MRKIIALLCSLVLFVCISAACFSNTTGGADSSNISPSVMSSEEDSVNIQSEDSSAKEDSSSEESSFDIESEASSLESEEYSGEESSKDNETEQYYTVTFNSDGGTYVAEQRVSKGEKIIKPEDPQKTSTETTDFEFSGWYVDGIEWDFDKNTVEKDIILYAKWQEKKYSIDLPI